MPATSPRKSPRSAWPIAIACYFIVAITGIAIFVSWAVGQNADLVRKDYYAEEIRFQSHWEQMNRAQQLAARPGISYDAVRDAVIVSFAGQPSSISGKVQFYRPSNATLDKNVKLSLDSNCSQQIDARHFAAGLWKVRLNWIAGAEEFFAEETVVIAHPRS
jgi:nitrogen fixation protein FixH